MKPDILWQDGNVKTPNNSYDTQWKDFSAMKLNIVRMQSLADEVTNMPG